MPPKVPIAPLPPPSPEIQEWLETTSYDQALEPGSLLPEVPADDDDDDE